MRAETIYSSAFQLIILLLNGLLLYLHLRAFQFWSEAWYQFSIICDEIRKIRALWCIFQKAKSVYILGVKMCFF